MRHEVLLAFPLTFTLLAAVPMRAQGVAYRAASSSARILAPVISDTLAARVPALASLLSRWPVPESVPVVDTTHSRPACPMPILLPDSSKHFAAIKSGSVRSADRMPMRTSSCVNPLSKTWQTP